MLVEDASKRLETLARTAKAKARLRPTWLPGKTAVPRTKML
jgi:hypothetical protein